MKQGRTFGSYFLFLLREGLFRLKTELLSWRGIIMLFIVGYMLLDTFEAIKESSHLMFQGIGALWLILLFPPRMGKLLYLLPFSKKDRARYLGTYSVSYLVFHIMVFFAVGVIAYLISGYPLLLWMRHFALYTFPFMMLYSGTIIDNMSVAVRKSYPTAGWFFSTRDVWQQKTDNVAEIREDCRGAVSTSDKTLMSEEEKAKAKKQVRFTICIVCCTIIPAVQCCGSYMYIGLCERIPWLLWVGTGLSYLCALIGLYLYWNRISEEMSNKGSTGKEECGCNS